MTDRLLASLFIITLFFLAGIVFNRTQGKNDAN